MDRLFTQRVSSRIAGLAEAQTLGMAQRVRDLRSQGKRVVSLLLGEPDFPVPEPIQEAAIQAIREGVAPYPPVPGLAPLREAIANYYACQYGVPVSPHQVVISNGSKQAIYNALLSILEPGDEVIIPVPYWVSYLPLVHLAQGRPVLVPTNQQNQYRLTPDQLARYITPRTRALILNSPSNPTGTTYSREDYAALVEVLRDHPHIWIIADEIYDLLVYEGKAVSFLEFAELRERTIVCNGFSKAFAMPGWRLGYLIASPDIAQAAIKVQGQTTAGANIIAQKAAIAGLTSDIETLLAPMRKAFRERRDVIYQYLATHHPELHPYKPEGAFYFFLSVEAYLGRKTAHHAPFQTADDMADYLLEHGLALVPGTGFGMPTHIRLSYAVALSEIEAGLSLLTSALHALA